MNPHPVENEQELEIVAAHIRGRRTIKLFHQRPVSRKLILDAIEAARWAPSHHVTEPWHFYLLGPDSTRGSIELIRTITTENKGPEIADFKARSASAVPGWLVVTCRKSDDELRQQEDYASCACAIQNLMIYLSAAGAASKWSTGAITRDERFYRLLGIDPAAESIVGLIWYGWPRIAPTQSRKDVGEIVSETK